MGPLRNVLRVVSGRVIVWFTIVGWQPELADLKLSVCESTARYASIAQPVRGQHDRNNMNTVNNRITCNNFILTT